MFTVERLAIGLASVLLPSLFAFCVAGRYAAEVDEFDWSTASISGTGMATAALAVWTAALALSTADDVSSTRQLARIEQDRFEKEDVPWVATGHGTWNETTVSTRLVNVGRGPAIGVFWEAHFSSETDRVVEVELPPPPPDRSGYAWTGTYEWWGVAGVLLSAQERIIEFSTWISNPDPAGKYGVHGWYSDLGSEHLIVFGDEPSSGWLTWLLSRKEGPLLESAWPGNP